MEHVVNSIGLRDLLLKVHVQINAKGYPSHITPRKVLHGSMHGSLFRLRGDRQVLCATQDTSVGTCESTSHLPAPKSDFCFFIANVELSP